MQRAGPVPAFFVLRRADLFRRLAAFSLSSRNGGFTPPFQAHPRRIPSASQAHSGGVKPPLPARPDRLGIRAAAVTTQVHIKPWWIPPPSRGIVARIRPPTHRHSIPLPHDKLEITICDLKFRMLLALERPPLFNLAGSGQKVHALKSQFAISKTADRLYIGESPCRVYSLFRYIIVVVTIARSKELVQKTSIIPVGRIESAIYFLRGQKVMLSTDLAALYRTEVRVLVQAVKATFRGFQRISCFN
jgi:hypothetical protein